MTATVAHPNFSTSFRTSQSAHQNTTTFSYADSSLTQLPTIDFQFDDLRRRMSEFTTKFDAYIERGRKQVLAERNDFRARLSELNGGTSPAFPRHRKGILTIFLTEEQKSTTTQITTLQSTLSTHSTLLTREANEKAEITSQITALESHATTQRDQRAKLQSAIATIKRQIETKRAAQAEYAAKYEAQAGQNAPELNFWETYLGCRMDGAGEDGVIRVVYCFPPARGEKEDREAVFELNVPDDRSEGYEIAYCKPKLAVEKVGKVVDRLNETRDIAVLLKGMRLLFQEELGERMAVR